MKILIIKNDGFGDLKIIHTLIEQLSNNEKFTIDFIISSKNLDAINNIKGIRYVYKFNSLANNYDSKKDLTNDDIENIQLLKKTKYDKCIVLRRYLNEEQVILMNYINADKKYSCFAIKHDKNIKLNDDWENIKISKENIHDYDYFKQFLINIKLIKENFKPISIYNKKISEDYLLINLSGEKGVSRKKDLKSLIGLISKNYNKKIVIIGKTFDDITKINIESYLNENSNSNIENLWNKTSFNESMKLIDNCRYYIGFDTGLSHHASLIKKKSLIILASGGGGKYWPYPNKLGHKTSYLMYNIPCSGCNYSGIKNYCFFDNKECLTPIFNNKNLEIKIKEFLNNEGNFFLNLSNFNFFISDWNFRSENMKKNLYAINKEGALRYEKKKLSIFMSFFYHWIILFLKLKKIKLDMIKIFIKNLLSFFDKY
ncbi:ADP-heptose:LPS heptosyltransferase [alpha proteobacterium HIMB114]|nr:ADP-heptose:LPS heptosyltransferase [alpha proteobacterium HIMB114]